MPPETAAFIKSFNELLYSTTPTPQQNKALQTLEESMVSQPKALIVDDEPSSRATIEAMLASENYELYFAENGAQALSMASEIRPDIILLDVMMPGMNGFEVCKKFRSMPYLTEVPIVLVTALDDQESRMAGIKSGADDFVTKPFD